MPRKNGNTEPRTGRKTGEPIPPEAWVTFLEKLALCPNVSRACELAGVSRIAAYDKRKSDPDFAIAWDSMKSIGWDAAEEEAVRRAVEGVSKPVYQGGGLVGHVREYSDGLLQFLLRGNKKATYADRTENINANIDVNDAMSEEDLNKLLAEKFNVALELVQPTKPTKKTKKDVAE